MRVDKLKFGGILLEKIWSKINVTRSGNRLNMKIALYEHIP